METPDPHTPETAPESPQALTLKRLRRPLAIALAISFALHAAVVGTLWIGILLQLPFAVEFEASHGIAMLDRIGRLHGDDLNTAPRYTNISENLPDFEAEAAAMRARAEEQARAEEEAARAEEQARIEEEERAAQARAEEELRLAAEAQARAERRRQRRENERLAERQAQAEAEAEARRQAEAEAQAQAEADQQTDATDEQTDTAQAQTDTEEPDAGPRLDLPPGERYPAGTINPIATDLGMWGPEGARLVVVMRNDRLRASAHSETATAMLTSFPDWRRLVGGADVNPLTDLDTIVIASSDPRYINRTFLVATHHMPAERVVATLSAGEHEAITWENDHGRLIGRPTPVTGVDPRVFFIPSEKVFAFTRPEFMDALRGDMPRAQGLEGAIETAEAVNHRGTEEADARITQALAVEEQLRALRPTDEPPLRDQGWLTGLMRVADYGGTERNGPAIMVSTGQIADLRIQGYRGVMPQGFHANVFAERDPRITARAIFSEKSEAEAFARAWQGILDANRSSLTLIGLYRPLSDAKLSVDHNETIIEFTVSQAIVRRLGVTLSQLMESR